MGLYLIFIVIVVWFIIFWCGQMRELMERKDTEFPGRFDKALWVVLLVAVPVIGVIVYCLWKGGRAEEQRLARELKRETPNSGG